MRLRTVSHSGGCCRNADGFLCRRTMAEASNVLVIGTFNDNTTGWTGTYAVVRAAAGVSRRSRHRRVFMRRQNYPEITQTYTPTGSDLSETDHTGLNTRWRRFLPLTAPASTTRRFPSSSAIRPRRSGRTRLRLRILHSRQRRLNVRPHVHLESSGSSAARRRSFSCAPPPRVPARPTTAMPTTSSLTCRLCPSYCAASGRHAVIRHRWRSVRPDRPPGQEEARDAGVGHGLIANSIAWWI